MIFLRHLIFIDEVEREHYVGLIFDVKASLVSVVIDVFRAGPDLASILSVEMLAKLEESWLRLIEVFFRDFYKLLVCILISSIGPFNCYLNFSSLNRLLVDQGK